jgi:hypothetical protein
MSIVRTDGHLGTSGRHSPVPKVLAVSLSLVLVTCGKDGKELDIVIVDPDAGAKGCSPGSLAGCRTACGTTGKTSCSQDGLWRACEVPAEACNGLDDDCDGAVDEGFPCARGTSTSCMTIDGRRGTSTCSDRCAVGTCVATPASCAPFIARSPAPWTLETSASFHCNRDCALLVGSPPLSWGRGPIATKTTVGTYVFNLMGLRSGVFRASFGTPSEGCGVKEGTIPAGSTVCPSGPWAVYAGSAVTPTCSSSAREWAWCGDPGDGYTCSLMFTMDAAGAIRPAGNCHIIGC